MKEMEIRELRLDLIDRLHSYGVTVKELIPFDEELRALVGLPAKQRERQLNKLAGTIGTDYYAHSGGGSAYKVPTL